MAEDTAKARVVVIDDARVDRDLALAFLGEHGYRAIGAPGGPEGLELCRELRPDVIVLDLVLPGTDGLQVLDAIRAEGALSRTPVLILTAQDSGRLAAEGLNRGADDFVRKPSHVELLARIETVLHRRAIENDLVERAAELRTAASNDVVTGLPNRRLLEEELDRLMAAAERHGRPLCVAMVDVDGFKQVNDDHGHAAGDSVLKRVGTSLASRLRASDMVGRWGGDEFLVLLPDTTADGAERVIEDLRATAEAGAPPTISVGWAEWGEESAAELVRRADQALYQAKVAGRNSVSAAR